MFEGWNGTKVVSATEYWIEYDGNHPNEQETATDVVMGGVQWTGSYWRMWVERISTNVKTFVALEQYDKTITWTMETWCFVTYDGILHMGVGMVC